MSIHMLFDNSIIQNSEDALDFIMNILTASTEYSIIGTDPEGMILLWNEGARRIYGYEPEEVIGRMNMENLYDPEESSTQRIHTIREAIFAHGKWEGLTRRMRKTGEIFDARVVITPRRAKDGTLAGFLIISKDISEEILLEELKVAQLYTRSLIAANLDTLIVTDLSGMITDVNQQACLLTGYSREELLGTPYQRYFADPQLAQARIDRAQNEEHAKNYELMLRNRKGEDIPLSCNATTFYTSDKQLLGILITARDISMQKTLDKQILQKNQELQEQYQRVQHADRLKSEFLANMSHELRTPLNSIIGFTDLLLAEIPGPLSEMQKDYLTDALSNGKHLLQLINDVLDLSKVEAGKMEFSPEPVKLAELIKGVGEILRPLAAEKRIRIETEIDPTLIEIVLDPVRFKQVLYNYLSNAVKFTPDEGKILIRIVPEQPDTFRIEVQDTGIGVRPEDLGRLFVEFQQLDASTSKKYQGTGLGLALTRRLVEAQGGSVGVQSQPEIGSTFFAILPRACQVRIEERSEIILPKKPLPGARCILIIDDDMRDREQLAQICINAGYAVELAKTGQEAVNLCRQQTFDLITLDLILPDLDGWDVLRAIRAEERNQDTPIIVVTVVKERGIGAGFAIQDVLTKPIQIGEVQQTLHTIFAHINPTHKGDGSVTTRK
ncbi:MAG TPA: PAS domain S-box protein [Ktedonobacteraceae bacterium]